MTVQQTMEGVREATIADTVRVAGKLLVPTLAGGVIVRRPKAMAVAERLQADAAAIAALQDLRCRYGTGPLRLRVPGREVVLLLSPDDVGRVLAEGPEPFTPATREKVAALRHFQPHGVLISRGDTREARRELNEALLQMDHALHRLAEPIVAKAREEMLLLLEQSSVDCKLGWDRFAPAFWRAVRRIVLGDTARDDSELTDQLKALRSDGNRAYLHPRRERLRQQFDRRLREHVGAGPDSLAGVIGQASRDAGIDPAGQIPHWLFAFDAAGIAAFRTLALLATHPDQAEQARAEITGLELSKPQVLPYLRACVLDSLRLWPTTPILLRESTGTTTWQGADLPAGTTFLVFTPFFHRDLKSLPYADTFAPEIWLDGRAQDNPALVPFSAGPARCPGENIVLLVTSTMLATLAAEHRFRLAAGPQLTPARPLPATVNHFGLGFDITAHRPVGAQ